MFELVLIKEGLVLKSVQCCDCVLELHHLLMLSLCFACLWMLLSFNLIYFKLMVYCMMALIGPGKCGTDE